LKPTVNLYFCSNFPSPIKTGYPILALFSASKSLFRKIDPKWKHYPQDVLPLMPCTGECLVIEKLNNFKMTLIRRGEKIALKYVAPDDFDETAHRVIPDAAHVRNFIAKLKNRNDPVPSIGERLQFHANSLATLAKDPKDPKLGSALNFLSNQLFNWIHKTTEYNKALNFAPSAIRLALLVKNQTRSAFSVR